ncbi:ethylbenzene dehydrogenase-related protein [Halobacterium yunchengense]|uniref:ethylbenzene dehydrogenase-related protein n=1 Tax=Halobacterium yunchengense TaxID=3108497 RepID=UPI0030084682
MTPDRAGGPTAEWVLAGCLAALLVVSAAAVPTLTAARPAHEIPVYGASAADGESLQRADGDAWADAPATTVPMSSAGAAVPNADDTTVERVRVEVARTDARLYMRLSWADGSRDTSADEIHAFADGVAVQLPRNETSRPPIAMGSTDNLVNVWYWSGATGNEELLAGGPGTTTAFAESTLQTNASYEDGRWNVVFSRSIGSRSENRTAIPQDRDMDVAFAAWNGSNMERSGQKTASEWYYLALGPGPQGPPYETILWVVAGIAIVATTLVTLEGVRRTRGD